MEVSDTVQKVYEQALAARLNAHAPYSNFLVGAALKLKNSDKIISGCNVENASYGATVCAERTALQSAVAQYGKQDYDFIVVVTNTDPATGPCALCLQVMGEFCKPDFPVYLANTQGIEKLITYGDLLPNPFNEIPEQCKN